MLARQSARRASSRLKHVRNRSVESITDVPQSPKSISESEVKHDRKLIKKEKVETGKVSTSAFSPGERTEHLPQLSLDYNQVALKVVCLGQTQRLPALCEVGQLHLRPFFPHTIRRLQRHHDGTEHVAVAMVRLVCSLTVRLTNTVFQVGRKR